MRVMRQAMIWFGTQDDRAFQRDRFPVYIAETPAGHFYGLPVIDGFGHKAAMHYGAPELISADQIDRQPRPEDEAPVRDFLSKHLPSASGRVRRSQVCTYCHSRRTGTSSSTSIRTIQMFRLPPVSRGTASSSRRLSAKSWPIWWKRVPPNCRSKSFGWADLTKSEP